MKRKILIGVLLAICLSGPAYAADPPEYINYQGVLRDVSDNPLDGTYDVIFRFWSDENGGDVLLTDIHNNAAEPVTVTGGLFNVKLGAGTLVAGVHSTLLEVFMHDSDVWMEIKVGTEWLSPRVQVVSAGYALNAGSLQGRSASEFIDTSSTSQTKSGPFVVDTRGLSNHGIEGYGDDYGGVFEGSTGGGDFRDAEGTSYARVARSGVGIIASGNSLGVEAWGNQAGIEASGDWAGGQFWTEGGSGDCRAGYGNIGVWAYGDIGIQATGTQAGAYFDSVGIGTSTPSVQLDVVGDAKVSGLIESSSGGVKFPDGSVQSTAADTTVCDELDQKIDELTDMMRWLTDAVWSDGWQTHSVTPGPSTYSSIAVGSQGEPVISYHDQGSGYLKVAHCYDVTCLDATLTDVDPDGAYYTSIAVGSDGNPVISYRAAGPSDLRVAHCNNLSCGDPTVSTLDSAGTVGDHSSIAIGSDGLPVISYNKAFSGGGLKVAHCDDPSCTSATLSLVDSGSGTGVFTSVAIGSDNLPVISYHNGSGDDLRVAHCDDVLCSSATLTTVDSVGHVGEYTSIAIGADGFPVISYYDYTNGDLKVAHCGDLTCSIATLSVVDYITNVGQHTSMAIMQGLPVISYYDATGANLKLARCEDPSCTSATLATIDRGGDVGEFASIALIEESFPVISYSDSTNGDLKVAAPNGVPYPQGGTPEAKRGSFRDSAIVSSQFDQRRPVRSAVNASADRVVRVSGLPIDEDGNVYANSFRPRRTDLAGLSPVSERVEAGDVLVIDRERSGLASLARRAADTGVFGVVATEPGVMLGAEPPTTLNQDGVDPLEGREEGAVAEGVAEEDASEGMVVPVAVSGVTLCKVDAGYGAIRPGDLLTTSPTPGHAMLAHEPLPGTILGKALEPLEFDTGLIKVLVMLR